MAFAESIINEEGFRINPEKTRLYKSKGKRIVTGISISGKELKIPKNMKRKLRQEAHYVTKYGIESHTQHTGIKDSSYINRLEGKLIFWKFVEPDNCYVSKILPKIYDMAHSQKKGPGRDKKSL